MVWQPGEESDSGNEELLACQQMTSEIPAACQILVADDILDALTEFQHRFYAHERQLHPVLDCYAQYMLRLYDHYEPYVADAMIMSSCTFIDGSCLEIRALSKKSPTKREAKLWPYYVRSLSGKPEGRLIDLE